MSEPKSREGTQFGPYRLLRLIGKGGMGEVYEAEDTVKDRVVALKLLPEGVSHDPVFRKRLQREAHSAGRLQEPHVVPIHDYGEIDGVLYVDMRMINGSDLRKILKNFGPMTPARAVAIVRQIASALDAAHEGGVMHRDVKPENILINRDDFAYLVDFGIANAASDEKLTELGTAVGTYAYMAPERFTSGVVTYRADIYALACVLHECLTGSQPYGGDSVSVVITAHLMQPIPRPSAERPGVPAAFDQVIARGMAKKPDERFASAGDLAMAATAALTARDQDQAETILQRGEAATLPSKRSTRPRSPRPHPVADHRSGPRRHPAPPPGATPPPPPPFGATPPPGTHATTAAAVRGPSSAALRRHPGAFAAAAAVSAVRVRRAAAAATARSGRSALASAARLESEGRQQGAVDSDRRGGRRPRAAACGRRDLPARQARRQQRRGPDDDHRVRHQDHGAPVAHQDRHHHATRRPGLVRRQADGAHPARLPVQRVPAGHPAVDGRTGHDRLPEVRPSPAAPKRRATRCSPTRTS